MIGDGCGQRVATAGGLREVARVLGVQADAGMFFGGLPVAEVGERDCQDQSV
jgi:hypothetical protein